jgi:hypothetical protein
MATNNGKVSAMRCVSGEGGNLYFQLKLIDETFKTFVVKADDPSCDTYASILAASVSTNLEVLVESEPYEPQPNYHVVSQVYAGKWR